MAKEESGKSTISQISFPRLSNAFDAQAFDDNIRAHGVTFVHYRAMRNPVGMVDKNDSRRPDQDESGPSNGMVYTKAGCVTALFIGNSKHLRAMESGLINNATAQITPARCYDGTEERVFLHPMDRLYLQEESILVTHQQLNEVSETGIDRLKFPAAHVQDLVDAQNISYKCGTDFDVKEGKIHWKQGKGPGINTEINRGRVYAIRYLYRPHWYVDHMLHEIRVAQALDNNGESTTINMPQAAVVNREYVYLNTDNNSPEDTDRETVAPRDGGFGPR